MHVTVIQHVPFESPAVIGDVLRERDIDIQVVRTDLGMPLPPPRSVDALVVMGGPMGALDDFAHAHLPAERGLIAECARRGTPVLGVCLGAQLLAASLGGRVYRGPSPEVGIGAVRLTEGGRRDAILGGAGSRLSVLHWHQDTFELPDGATLLASSTRYPHQAFRWGSAYGLQFHIEIDAAAFEQAAEHMPPDVVIDPRTAQVVSDRGRQVLCRWAEHVLRRRPVTPVAR